MPLYPINLDIADHLCVVIGGGRVATRKVTSLLHCNARVRIISPDLTDDLRNLLPHPSIEWRQRPFISGDLHGATLAFALTNNPTAQKQITREAKSLGILLNVADNPQACSFQTPASLHRGDLLIAISTGGNSPVLSSIIRQELEARYGEEYGDLITLLGAIRQQAMATLNEYSHQKMVPAILETGVLQLLKDHDQERLQQTLQKILPGTIDISSCLPHWRRD